MSRLNEFTEMLKEKRVGFKMEETMQGEHSFEPGCGPAGRFPFEFSVTWGPDHLGSWLNPFGEGFMSHKMHGHVSIGGLVDHAPISGHMELRYFKDATIRYEFSFEASGVSYRFVGEKVNIKPWNLPTSHTTCFGTLTEEPSGRLVSRSITYFKMKTAPAFIASMRLA